MDRLRVYYSGQGSHPVYIYQYRETRTGGFLKDFLAGFKGYVQCDGYAGYNILKELFDIIIVYCWAHVRRKFHEALKATKKKTGSSREGMAWVQKLYAVEREADKKNLTPEERKELRAKKSAPILEKFKAWLDKKVLTVAPVTSIQC